MPKLASILTAVLLLIFLPVPNAKIAAEKLKKISPAAFYAL
jgi:hypothetical protein